ncbi:hypothetical protein RSOLAG1IB_11579 [Rhizoctonia solani AG-1 IB]|uniref:Uncharacterized protein n=1 Tax=Thanatephorus cucumeris (strain AG1-IB / isolate 7/3/14) TaxID=1108050 RepID=A0A0B7F808_THACB|nr:hypothetical protein RSOLAG1IB_11579 [Rhizoctonia solani AG-1 IB]
MGVLRPPAHIARDRRRALRHTLASSSFHLFIPHLGLSLPLLGVSSLGGAAPVAPRLGVPPLPLPSYRPPVPVVSLLDFIDYARSRPKAK